MTDVISAVPVYDITMPRGALRVVRCRIEKDGVNVDLSLPAVQVVFTARHEHGDVLIQKSYASPGTTPTPGIEPGGIVAQQVLVNAVQVWVADVTIDPADTEAIEEPLIPYDIWLLDSAQEAPCAQGTLKLAPTVLRP